VRSVIMMNTARISNLMITGKRLNIQGKRNEKLIDLIESILSISSGETDA